MNIDTVTQLEQQLADLGITNLLSSVEEALKLLVEDEERFKRVDDFTDLGLDGRAYCDAWVDLDGQYLVTEGRINCLCYYGGFEYVDEAARTSIGSFTIWNADLSNRVDSAICRFLGKKSWRNVDEEDEDDEE